ncbi:MAG TPA: ABC transporter permease [Chitinophagales bacterium]|nr:ABC transporter permease [Chitinophagales bacterium]HMX03776.1 ABC transporter permease [Chitinophagales bacterium]HMZ89935.1 ABC transporter permease [Chitinophagales bacterium]HNA58267.1 ABC transporter permease [Chitinophagales bacterium]HNI53623.1 ABC transporter permease [Chitinophagales bacterium]
MKNVFTIFKKEIKDILRDKRTLTVMLIIPLFVYPAIFVGISKYVAGQTEKAGQETLRIAIIDNGNANHFSKFVAGMPNTSIKQIADTTSAQTMINNDSIDVAYYFPAGYDSAIAKLEPTTFEYFYTSTNNEFEVAIIENLNNAYKQQLIKEKLEDNHLSGTILEPAKPVSRNLASSREQIGSMIGGILPYFFIIFCMIGCMYPAIDLAAGEKERGSLETLLVSSASRLEIYLGKLITVTLSGFISAMASIAGIIMSGKLIGADASQDGGIAQIADLLNGIMEPGSIAMMLLILLPLNIFFAAVTLMLSIYARSFKEAQSMITPLMIFIVFPTIFGMLPGVTLDYGTALVPILNVSLGAKEIISGTVEMGPLLLTYLALFVYAGIALMVSVRFFNNEKNILRG